MRLRAVDQNDAPKTTISQASVGVQRELGGGMVLSADFVYTRGSNLATLVNLNQPLPNAAGNNALGALPYPNFGFIEWRAQNGKSDYKGVDLGLEKRFAHGYAFGVAYTLGNSKDNASEQLTTQGSNAFPQNARDFEPWYGPSDYDVRHRFTRELRVGAAARRQRDRARLDGRPGIYAARSGPSVHRQPEQQQRRHEHDRPAERDRRPQRPEDGGPVVQHRGVPGRCRPARSATSCAIS